MNGSEIYLYEGEIVHILHPDAVIFLTQIVRGKFQEYNAYMPQVVACAKRSNFRYPADLNFLIHQSTASVAHDLRHPNIDKEWMKYFMADIEGRSSGKPTP